MKKSDNKAPNGPQAFWKALFFAGTHIHDKALVDGRCGEIGYECHDKPYGTDKQNDTEYEIEDIIL